MEFSQLLLRIGGLNPFGGPNLSLLWGEHMGVRERFGLVPPQNGLPCWGLCIWHPPDDAGPPERWLPLLSGPYPQYGFYETVQPMYREIGGLVEPMPLERRPLEVLCWIHNKHRHDSHRERKRVFAEHQARERQRETDKIADALQDSYPAFNGAESFSGVPNTVVRKRMESMAAYIRPIGERGLRVRN